MHILLAALHLYVAHAWWILPPVAEDLTVHDVLTRLLHPILIFLWVTSSNNTIISVRGLLWPLLVLFAFSLVSQPFFTVLSAIVQPSSWTQWTHVFLNDPASTWMSEPILFEGIFHAALMLSFPNVYFLYVARRQVTPLATLLFSCSPHLAWWSLIFVQGEMSNMWIRSIGLAVLGVVGLVDTFHTMRLWYRCCKLTYSCSRHLGWLAFLDWLVFWRPVYLLVNPQVDILNKPLPHIVGVMLLGSAKVSGFGYFPTVLAATKTMAQHGLSVDQILAHYLPMSFLGSSFPLAQQGQQNPTGNGVVENQTNVTVGNSAQQQQAPFFLAQLLALDESVLQRLSHEQVANAAAMFARAATSLHRRSSVAQNRMERTGNSAGPLASHLQQRCSVFGQPLQPPPTRDDCMICASPATEVSVWARMVPCGHCICKQCLDVLQQRTGSLQQCSLCSLGIAYAEIWDMRKIDRNENCLGCRKHTNHMQSAHCLQPCLHGPFCEACATALMERHDGCIEECPVCKDPVVEVSSVTLKSFCSSLPQSHITDTTARHIVQLIRQYERNPSLLDRLSQGAKDKIGEYLH